MKPADFASVLTRRPDLAGPVPAVRAACAARAVRAVRKVTA